MVGPFSYGDVVTFDIEVANQGNQDIYNALVNDFIPCGYRYLGSNNPLWIYDSGTGIATTTIAGVITPGNSETISITLEVIECHDAGAWTNIAEVESFEDENGEDITDEDIDSDGDEATETMILATMAQTTIPMITTMMMKMITIWKQ